MDVPGGKIGAHQKSPTGVGNFQKRSLFQRGDGRGKAGTKGRRPRNTPEKTSPPEQLMSQKKNLVRRKGDTHYVGMGVRGGGGKRKGKEMHKTEKSLGGGTRVKRGLAKGWVQAKLEGKDGQGSKTDRSCKGGTYRN